MPAWNPSGSESSYSNAGVKMLNVLMRSSQHVADPGVGEAPAGIQRGADALEVVPARVARGQLLVPEEAALAPVRAPAELRERGLDVPERGLIRHPLKDEHGDERAVASVGG